MIHPIPPGLWCVPSAIVAITGEPWDAVVHPALNRHANADTLTGVVVGVFRPVTIATLEELGWKARRYRGKAPEGSWVKTWARRYPTRTILLLTATHALVAHGGRIYDNHAPHGPAGAKHPYGRTRVREAYLVEKIAS